MNEGMKRGAEREMASPEKRPRAAYEIRVLIPSRVVGCIIGKGGGVIQRLRTENKATVNVPDCPGPERVLTIGADEQDATVNVLSQVLELIQEEQSKGETDDGIGNLEIRLLFHHSQVGSVIGKAGSVIKGLREETKAQIKVYGNVCPRSTDRVVAIGGPVDVCIETVNKCLVLISESPLKGPIQKYDPHNFDEYHAQEYGGFGGGSDYYRGPSRGFREGGSTRNGRDSGPRGSRGSNGFGPPSHRPFSSTTMGHGGGGGDESSSCQVTIPNEYAGAIIGKGGTRIRRIRSESGAGITIAEPVSGQNERIITITGAPGQIRMAQYLLQQSVKEHL